MPILGAVLAVLVAIGVSTSLTHDAAQTVQPAVQVVVGAHKTEAPKLHYVPLPVVTEEPEPVPASPVQKVIPRPTPQPLFVAPTPEPLVAPSPATETPVSACLGKVVGTQCSYTTDGVTQNGTCLTIAWSPLTCVPH